MPGSASAAAVSSTLRARQAVDDAAVAGLLALQEAPGAARLRLQLGHDAVADVGAVEAGDEDAALAEVEPLDDLAPGRRVGGGGQRQARHAGKRSCSTPSSQVVGPEIVAPLRDAVRLVDREQGEPAAAEQVEEARSPSAARARRRRGRAAPSRIARSTAVALAEVERGVEHRGAHAELAQRRRPGPASARSAARPRRASPSRHSAGTW